MASFDITNKWEYSEDGVNGMATKNTTTNFDYKITSSNLYLSGGEILTQNSVFGDWITVQLVDKDGVYYSAGTVLRVYIIKKYINPSTNRTIVNNPYAGNPPLNVYLRVGYHSVGTTTDVNVATNFYLHSLI